MKQAITRTIIFAVIIVLMELAMGYFKRNSNEGAYSFADSNIGLISIFIVAYFLLQVFKFRRLNN